MNCLNHEDDRAIRFLLEAGVSIREIVRRTGFAKSTIILRKGTPTSGAPNGKAGVHQCDFCGSRVKHKEFHRRTARTRHKFCTHECYGAFYRYLRRNVECVRCGIQKNNDGWCLGHNWCRGMCGRCYGIMRSFGFDANMADAYDLSQDLKKEIRNVGG